MTPEIRRRRLIALAIVLGALAVMIVLIALRPRPQRQRPPAADPLVAIEIVREAAKPVTVTGWGTVQPRDAITLVPQVGGRVVAASANLRAGGFFPAGEILIEIEPTDYELMVEQARSQVAQAEVALALAREEAAAARLEWERTSRDALGGAGMRDPDQAPGDTGRAEPGPLVLREPQLRQAQANLAASRAALRRAELDLVRCRITAPFDGRVQSQSVAVGQVVRPGEILASIHDIQTSEITVHVPDRELAWIDVSMTSADINGGTPAAVRATFAGSEHTWPGRVVRLGGSVDPGSRQVPVVVEVAAPYEPHEERPPLMSGMFVNVTFTSEPPPGAVVIDRKALRPGDLVWTLDGEDRLRIGPVTVARTDLETAVITSGLKPGDRLITSSLQYVIDGMRLTPVSPAAPANISTLDTGNRGQQP
jgi:RND family efflux transporter MFP subunit